MYVNWEMNKQGIYHFSWILFQIDVFLLSKFASFIQMLGKPHIMFALGFPKQSYSHPSYEKLVHS